MAPKSAMDIIVKVGTQFRMPYQDGNPLWEVESITGPHAAVVCVDEPIEFEGMTFPSDAAGVRSSALVSDIRNRLAAAAFVRNVTTASEDFWKGQADGTTLHYHNSFGEFVRGEVVTVDGKKQLKPTALVGTWRDYDIIQRAHNGKLSHGYHARKIIEGASWTPHATCIFESPSYGESNARHGDPRTMEPINIALPGPKPADKVRHMRENAIESVIAGLRDTSVDVEERIAAAISALQDAR